LHLALGRGERGVGRGHAVRQVALVVALLPEVGEPFLVGFALLPGLLFARSLVGLAFRLGEPAPPVQLFNWLDGVGQGRVFRDRAHRFEFVLEGGAPRFDFLALGGERLGQGV